MNRRKKSLCSLLLTTVPKTHKECLESKTKTVLKIIRDIKIWERRKRLQHDKKKRETEDGQPTTNNQPPQK